MVQEGNLKPWSWMRNQEFSSWIKNVSISQWFGSVILVWCLRTANFLCLFYDIFLIYLQKLELYIFSRVHCLVLPRRQIIKLQIIVKRLSIYSCLNKPIFSSKGLNSFFSQDLSLRNIFKDEVWQIDHSSFSEVWLYHCAEGAFFFRPCELLLEHGSKWIVAARSRRGSDPHALRILQNTRSLTGEVVKKALKLISI